VPLILTNNATPTVYTVLVEGYALYALFLASSRQHTVARKIVANSKRLI